MTPLRSRLLDDASRRAALVAAGAALVRDRVEHRRGARGLALRAALRTLEASRPDALPHLVERLLPDFVAALAPLHRAAASRAGDSIGFLLHDPPASVAALLTVADRRVKRSARPGVKPVYARLRKHAERELLDAMPALSAAMDQALADDC